MPRRSDIHKVLIIGSGPIIIGQACEFDYAGTQACRTLKQEGIGVVLINSNPATIMTDPDMADVTYIEPITVDVLEQIIIKEKPDACLPTMGGQTGLNIAVEACEKGIFGKYGVKLIGADYDTIKKAENRKDFKAAMDKIGIDLPRSFFAYSVEEALGAAEEIGYPVIVRPSFTLGGFGGGVCLQREDLEKVAHLGLRHSRIKEILVEEALLGWKEYELEVMRDNKDNVVIVCSIENLDPMGVHTGDSITVAPVQTLTDREYQNMRDTAIEVIREIGIDTGGSNIQFAVNPQTGRMVVIEVNPRVSRSSALASKATGFPIAKVATKLAIGYTLDEIPNDITKETCAAFEPALDYCVVKIPLFAFEKFQLLDNSLGSQMQSVGESMAIGRTFKEALQKGLRSIETGRYGLGCDGKDRIFGNAFSDFESLALWKRDASHSEEIKNRILEYVKIPRPDRIFYLKYAYYAGISTDKLSAYSNIDQWFLDNIKQIVEIEEELLHVKKITFPGSKAATRSLLITAKGCGFSDKQIAFLWKCSDAKVRRLRKRLGVKPSFKIVDTCAGEFQAHTPYYYSTYDSDNESLRSRRKKVMILGSGPNRIGQGIEFDYCCCQAVFALKQIGYETIMVNSNPETVSTDYDISDKLYFEPLTLEDILNIYETEKPKGVIVQLGGQTPINLSRQLKQGGVRILGTSVKSIDVTENRRQFRVFAERFGIKIPQSFAINNTTQALKAAETISYPVIIRPSYVLGGRSMEIIYDKESLARYMAESVNISADSPLLIEKFLENALEVDVDLIGDGHRYVIGAVMEHIEEAGVHSGDSAMAIPTFSLLEDVVKEIKSTSKKIASKLKIKGLMNIQYAVMNGRVYCIEVNSRASRTIPFVSKSIARPLAFYAAKIMLGKNLRHIGFTREVNTGNFSVKESVFPFIRLKVRDIVLSPEMHSTGEVMGIDRSLAIALYKSQIAALGNISLSGRIFISVKDADKPKISDIAKEFVELGYELIATRGTALELRNNGIDATVINKVEEGGSNIKDMLKLGEIALIINTPSGKDTAIVEAGMRTYASSLNVVCFTNLRAAQAMLSGIKMFKLKGLEVKSIQEYNRNTKN